MLHTAGIGNREYVRVRSNLLHRAGTEDHHDGRHKTPWLLEETVVQVKQTWSFFSNSTSNRVLASGNLGISLGPRHIF